MELIEETKYGPDVYTRIYEATNREKLIEYLNEHWNELDISAEDIKEGKTYRVIEYHDESRPTITIIEKSN